MHSKRSKAWHNNKQKEQILRALGPRRNNFASLPDGTYDAEMVSYSQGEDLMTIKILGKNYTAPNCFPDGATEVKFKMLIKQHCKS